MKIAALCKDKWGGWSRRVFIKNYLVTFGKRRGCICHNSYHGSFLKISKSNLWLGLYFIQYTDL